MKALKAKMKSVVDMCTFLGEFPSVWSKPFSIISIKSLRDDKCIPWVKPNPLGNVFQSQAKVENVSIPIEKSIFFIEMNYKESCVEATQFKAFICADLDNICEGEQSHSACIGYFLSREAFINLLTAFSTFGVLHI